MVDTGNAQDRITAFWSTIAAGYEEHPGNTVPPGSEAYAAWVEVLRGALPRPPSDVLDVATGTGFVAFIAAELGHRVTGVDLAAGMLEVARSEAAKRGLDARILEGDAVAPPFEAGSFDALTSRHFLWTLREPDEAFANWFRLLRSGGRLIAIDGFWFPEASAEAVGQEAEPDIFQEHYTSETRAELPFMNAVDATDIARRLTAAGFSDITTSKLDWVPELGGGTESAPYVLVARRP